MTFDEEHALETYKSMISIGQFGLRFVLLINGGAAVAILAFVGDLASSVGKLPDVEMALTWYVRGIALGGFALLFSYMTQLVLFNEAVGNAIPRHLRNHRFWLNLSMVLVVLSLVAFALGSFDALNSYEALFVNKPGPVH